MWKAVLKWFGDVLTVVRYGRFVCYCWWRSTVLTCRFWYCISILLKVYLKIGLFLTTCLTKIMACKIQDISRWMNGKFKFDFNLPCFQHTYVWSSPCNVSNCEIDLHMLKFTYPLLYCLLIYERNNLGKNLLASKILLTSTGNVVMSSNSFELWFLKYPAEWKELKSSEIPPSK